MKLNANELYKREMELTVKDFRDTSQSTIELKYNESGDICSVIEDGIEILNYITTGPHPDAFYLHRDVSPSHTHVYLLKEGANPLDYKNGYALNHKALN